MRLIHYVGAAVLGWAGASGVAHAADAAGAGPAAPGLALIAPALADPLPMPASVRAWLPLTAPPAAGRQGFALAGGARAAPVAPDRLEGARGGTDIVSNDARLQGLVGGNAAIDVSSGANIIGGGAFTNMAGLPIVIQNSGANVLIQNATIVNVQLR